MRWNCTLETSSTPHRSFGYGVNSKLVFAALRSRAQTRDRSSVLALPLVESCDTLRLTVSGATAKREPVV